jgi:hypothetical protein
MIIAQLIEKEKRDLMNWISGVRLYWPMVGYLVFGENE